MASPALITPTTTKPKLLVKSKITTAAATTTTTTNNIAIPTNQLSLRRREFASLAAVAAAALLLPVSPASAGADDEYVKDTTEVITKVRSTISLPKTDPNVADAVADLKQASNSWVAKYRKEKSLLGKPSFRDMYSALNAVSGHYVSFGPTAPIPAKRRARILEEMDTAEKALLRGR